MKNEQQQEQNTANWNLIDSFLTKTSQHGLIWGPPATGKTYSAMKTGVTTDAVVVTMTDDTSAADLLGYYINTPSGYIWRDGPCTTALRTGRRLVINEINHAGSDAEAFLFALLDNEDSSAITLMSGEVLHRPANFQCIATTNVDPSESLRAGLLSRFVGKFHAKLPHPAAVAALPEDLRSIASAPAESSSGAEPMTLRHYISFAAIRGAMGPEQAAKAVFGEGAEAILDSIRVAAS